MNTPSSLMEAELQKKEIPELHEVLKRVKQLLVETIGKKPVDTDRVNSLNQERKLVEQTLVDKEGRIPTDDEHMFIGS